MIKKAIQFGMASVAVMGLVACSGSAEEILPDIPKNEPDPNDEGVFKGRWVSNCQREKVNPFKSYLVTMEFEGNEMVVTSQYYHEDECFGEADAVEMEGTYKTKNAKAALDNMVTFKQPKAEDRYFRTAYFKNTGAFLITKFKKTAKEADKTPADISLYRQKEWNKIQAKLHSGLPKTSLMIEKDNYKLRGSSSCVSNPSFGKPFADYQRVYFSFDDPTCGPPQIAFICEPGMDTCETVDGSSWELVQYSEDLFAIKALFSTENYVYEK